MNRRTFFGLGLGASAALAGVNSARSESAYAVARSLQPLKSSIPIGFDGIISELYPTATDVIILRHGPGEVISRLFVNGVQVQAENIVMSSGFHDQVEAGVVYREPHQDVTLGFIVPSSAVVNSTPPCASTPLTEVRG